MGVESERSQALTSLASYYRSSNDFHDLYQITVIRGGCPSLAITRRKDMVVEKLYNTSEMPVKDIKAALSRAYGHLVTDIPLPEKEARYYEFVKSVYDKKGRFPYHSEVKQRMQWKSDNTCVSYRKMLQGKGYIDYVDGKYVPVK